MARPDRFNMTDGSDFAAIYQTYQRMVRAVLFNIVGISDLDDLVQETFVRIWRALTSFRGQSSIRTWVYRITMNVALDHCRKRGRWKWASASQPIPTDVNPERVSIARQLVHRGLLQLSDEHRAVIVLHSMEELSIPEIAVVLEIPEGTVRSRLYVAKQVLGEFLSAQGVKL